MELIYKGFICLNNEKHKLIIKKSEKSFIDIPIDGFGSDNLKINNNNSIKIVLIKFYDGTENVSLEKSYVNDFSDIFIAIHDNLDVIINKNQPVYDLIINDFENMNFVSKYVDDYYESAEGIESLKIFKENNPFK